MKFPAVLLVLFVILGNSSKGEEGVVAMRELEEKSRTEYLSKVKPYVKIFAENRTLPEDKWQKLEAEIEKKFSEIVKARGLRIGHLYKMMQDGALSLGTELKVVLDVFSDSISEQMKRRTDRIEFSIFPDQEVYQEMGQDDLLVTGVRPSWFLRIEFKRGEIVKVSIYHVAHKY